MGIIAARFDWEASAGYFFVTLIFGVFPLIFNQVVTYANVNPVTRMIRMPLKRYRGDHVDSTFGNTMAHEIAHYLRLPGNPLLANAYALCVGCKLDPTAWNALMISTQDEQAFERFSEIMGFDKTDFFLADEALKIIEDPMVLEATLRKICRDGQYRKRHADTARRQSLHKLLMDVSGALTDKDFNIPRFWADGLHRWAYRYGSAMGYIAMKSTPSAESALRFIYQLGQARHASAMRNLIPRARITVPRAELDLGQIAAGIFGVSL